MTAKLAEALAAFQAEMPTVAKTKTANTGKFSYSYADLADVTEAAMPILTKHGLSFATCPRQTERGYELRGVLLHSSGESLEGALPINGNSPQEMGSSLTYMRRYLFGCLTGIVTDNDDDGQLAQAAKTRRTRAPQQAAPAAAAPARESGELITDQQVKALNALLREAGLATDEARYAWLSNGCRREITSSKQLTKTEASRAIDALKKAQAES